MAYATLRTFSRTLSGSQTRIFVKYIMTGFDNSFMCVFLPVVYSWSSFFSCTSNTNIETHLVKCINDRKGGCYSQNILSLARLSLIMCMLAAWASRVMQSFSGGKALAILTMAARAPPSQWSAGTGAAGYSASGQAGSQWCWRRRAPPSRGSPAWSRESDRPGRPPAGRRGSGWQPGAAFLGGPRTSWPASLTNKLYNNRLYSYLTWEIRAPFIKHFNVRNVAMEVSERNQGIFKIYKQVNWPWPYFYFFTFMVPIWARHGKLQT